MRPPSIPKIIEGSWKEGFEIEWGIRYNGTQVQVEINLCTIPNYIFDSVEAHIMEQMTRHYPWVDVKFVYGISWDMS